MVINFLTCQILPPQIRRRGSQPRQHWAGMGARPTNSSGTQKSYCVMLDCQHN